MSDQGLGIRDRGPSACDRLEEVVAIYLDPHKIDSELRGRNGGITQSEEGIEHQLRS